MLQFDLQLDRPAFVLHMQGQFDQPVNVIQGPSGSGKSTLLNLLCGLLQPAQGSIHFRGQVWLDRVCQINVTPRLRRCGLMWQDDQLFPHLSVQQNLLYGYQLLAPSQQRIAPDELISLLQLSALLHRQPRHLSGGERQRVALGRTLLAAPQLLLLDEPLNAVSPALKQELLGFIRSIPQRYGIPVIYVSHQTEDRMLLGGALWHCDNGQLQGPF